MALHPGRLYLSATAVKTSNPAQFKDVCKQSAEDKIFAYE
jgi:hypothetical protein